MENKNSYTIVGLFFIISVTLFVTFMWWMSGVDAKQSGRKIYYIQARELPMGVRVDSQVKFIGVGVGSVSAIDFLQDDMIQISMKLRDDIDIKDDSVAEIELQPISGVASINISRGSGKSLRDSAHPVIPLEDSVLSKIRYQAQDISKKMIDGLDKLNALLSDENYHHISSTLKNLDDFSSVIGSKENARNLSELLANLNQISSNLKDLDINELNSILRKADVVLTGAGSSIEAFSKLANSASNRIISGEFDIKGALTPILNEAGVFLDSFSKTLREFRRAMDRLEENPYQFFFKDTSLEDKK